MKMWGLRQIYNLSHVGDYITYCPFVGVLFKNYSGSSGIKPILGKLVTLSSIFLLVSKMR